MTRAPFLPIALIPIVLSTSGCAPMTETTRKSVMEVGVTVGTLAVLAAGAGVVLLVREVSDEARKERTESLCQRQLREWKEVRLNPRDEPPQQLRCQPNGDFGTPGVTVPTRPIAPRSIAPRPAATPYFPSY